MVSLKRYFENTEKTLLSQFEYIRKIELPHPTKIVLNIADSIYDQSTSVIENSLLLPKEVDQVVYFFRIEFQSTAKSFLPELINEIKKVKSSNKDIWTRITGINQKNTPKLEADSKCLVLYVGTSSFFQKDLKNMSVLVQKTRRLCC